MGSQNELVNKIPKFLKIWWVYLIILIVYFVIQNFSNIKDIIKTVSNTNTENNIEKENIASLISNDYIESNVVLILTDFTSRVNEFYEKININSIIKLIEQRAAIVGLSDNVSIFYIKKQYSSKNQIESELRGSKANIIVVYGDANIIEDSTYLDLNFYCNNNTNYKYEPGTQVIKSQLKTLEEIGLFHETLAEIIFSRIRILYVFYLEDTAMEEQLINYIKKCINLKPFELFADYSDRIILEFYLPKLCNQYHKLKMLDSAYFYTNECYNMDPTSNYSYVLKANYLFNSFRKDNDTLDFVIELLNNAYLESIDDSLAVREFKSRVFAHKAQYYSNLQLSDSAIYYSNKAISYDSIFYMPYFIIGTNKLFDCEKEQSEFYYRRAYDLDSTNIFTNYYLGALMTLNGNFKLSKKYLNRAFLIDPKKFILEYNRNLKNIEYCKYDNFDSLAHFTSSLILE